MTYIGRHSTDNLNDGYLGSGTILKRAIKKYGKHNFEIIILDYYDSFEELVKEEEYIVTLEYCNNDDNYNIVPGGMNPIKFGKDNYMFGRVKSKEELEKIRQSSKKYYTPLVIYNIEYLSIDEAVKDLGLFKHIIIRNCYREPDHFKFKNNSDYDKYRKKYNTKNKVSCPVIIDNIEYKSIKEASKFLNIHETTVIKRCLRNDDFNKNCKFINELDYIKYNDKFKKKEVNLFKAVVVDDVVYHSQLECCRNFNITINNLLSRCLNDTFKNWKFLNEEYENIVKEARFKKITKLKRDRRCNNLLF